MMKQRMTGPLRVVLVGYGRIAERHVAAITASPKKWRLVGIVEPDASKIPPQHRSLPHARTARQFGKLGVAFDTVLIASPSGYHAEHAMWAIEHGTTSLIVEKPLALTLEDTTTVVRAAKQADVKLFCCYPMRLYPSLVLLKEALEQGVLGTLHTCESHIYWTRPQDYFDRDFWRGTRDLDGGIWLNQANHVLDLLVWLCGMPSELWAQHASLGREIEVADTAVMMGRWPSGMMGSLSATLLTWPRNMETSLTLLGSKGSVRLSGASLGDVEYWECEDQDFLECLRQRDLGLENESTRQLGYGPSYEVWWETITKKQPHDMGARWLELARWCDTIEVAATHSGHKLI